MNESYKSSESDLVQDYFDEKTLVKVLWKGFQKVLRVGVGAHFLLNWIWTISN